MKRILCMALTLAMIFSLAACGQASGERGAPVNQTQTVADLLKEAEEGRAESAESGYTGRAVSAASLDGVYDIDLTKMNGTMVYSEVYNMMREPAQYLGKTVKMQGTLEVIAGGERNYYTCLIADATACCAQGFEFVLGDDYKYPEDYPKAGTLITVTGVFDTYDEDDVMYFQLIDAKMGV